jgi:hypothetical protein
VEIAASKETHLEINKSITLTGKKASQIVAELHQRRWISGC